jgi:uncharacterized membrane protein
VLFHDYSVRTIAIVAVFVGLLDALLAFLKIQGRDKVSSTLVLLLGIVGVVFWTAVAWSARTEAERLLDWAPFVVLFAPPVYLVVAGWAGLVSERQSRGVSGGT